MKVIQIIPKLDIGGAQIMCESLSAALNDLSVEVLVLCLYTIDSPIVERIKSKGIKIYFLEKKEGFDFQCLKKIRNILKKEKPDIIHSHLYASKYAVISSLFMRIPIVHTIHSVANKENTRFGIFFNKINIRKHRIVPIALSQEIQKTVIDVYGIKKEQVPIVINGIDLSHYTENKEPAQKDFVIIHVGRFSDVKNQMLIIKAFENVRQKEMCKLWLIGDGEDFQSISAYVSKSEFRDSIILWGSQNDPAPFLNKASLFVLPSKYEGMPMSIEEAMASGLPIIASNVGGIQDMIVDGVNGVLIHPNESELSNAIIRLIQDKALREKLAGAAKLSSEKYSHYLMAKNYIKVYEKLDEYGYTL